MSLRDLLNDPEERMDNRELLQKIATISSNTIPVPRKIIRSILDYCEYQQIHDKLGRYDDFYYKLLILLKEEDEKNIE